MEKIIKATTPNALHAELCAAIADLAKSVDVAVSRITLRKTFALAIADAAKAERAAEALHAAAAHSTEIAAKEQVSLVPSAPTTDNSPPEMNSTADLDTSEPVVELYEACSWLARAQAPRLSPETQSYRKESAVAMRILELLDRLGGLIK